MDFNLSEGSFDFGCCTLCYELKREGKDVQAELRRRTLDRLGEAEAAETEALRRREARRRMIGERWMISISRTEWCSRTVRFVTVSAIFASRACEGAIVSC